MRSVEHSQVQLVVLFKIHTHNLAFCSFDVPYSHIVAGTLHLFVQFCLNIFNNGWINHETYQLSSIYDEVLPFYITTCFIKCYGNAAISASRS